MRRTRHVRHVGSMRVGHDATDRALDEIRRALNELLRDQGGDCDCDDGAPGPSGPTGAEGPPGSDGADGVDGVDGIGAGITAISAGVTTSASRRWMVFSPATWATTVAAAGVWTVPDGVTRITGLAIAIVTGTAGAPSSVNVTYLVTLGDATSETDTAISLTVAGNFIGSARVAGSVACTPGQLIRIACDKSGAMTTQQGGNGISALVTFGA